MLTEFQLNQIIDSMPQERFAIAFSGGGDSTALVHMCRNVRPAPLVLIVDHALRVGSRKEAKQAQKFASSLGLDARLLIWKHNNPTTGLQEKARRGRYGLMGQVCRDEGIRYLLTGHTRDDQAETLLMRYERNTGWRGAAGIAKQVYAPVWPALAKVSILRPLLEVSRSALRDYNQSHKLNWSEDPSNKNMDFERIRARTYLRDRPGMARHLLHSAQGIRQNLQSERARLGTLNPFKVSELSGCITTDRNASAQFLGFCLLAAGGEDSLPTPTQLSRLARQVGRDGFKSATLSNALIVAQDENLYIGSDPSVYKGRSNKAAIQPLSLIAGDSHIWGGRFLLSASQNLIVRPAGKDGNVLSLAPPDKFFQSSLPITDEAVTGFLRTEQLVEERLNGFLGKTV